MTAKQARKKIKSNSVARVNLWVKVSDADGANARVSKAVACRLLDQVRPETEVNFFVVGCIAYLG